MSDLPPFHELLAHSHLLTARQRRQSTLGPVGPLLCVRAEGEREGAPVAAERFFAAGCSPAAALTALRNYGPERDHQLFVADATPERERAFLRAGFRLVESQWLMHCRLADRPPGNPARADCAVQVAAGPADSLLLSAIDGLEPVLAEDLLDSALIHYYVVSNGQLTTYGRNAFYDSRIAWVSHIHTPPQFRRRGYAGLLMERLLHDSADLGITQSLLLSTRMGRSLYTRLGYRTLSPVAVLQLPPSLLRRSTRRA